MFQDYNDWPASIERTPDVLEYAHLIDKCVFAFPDSYAYPWHVVPFRDYAATTITAYADAYRLLCEHMLSVDAEGLTDYLASFDHIALETLILHLSDDKGRAFKSVERDMNLIGTMFRWVDAFDDDVWYRKSRYLKRLRREKRAPKQAHSFHYSDLLDCLAHPDISPAAKVLLSVQYDTLYRADSTLRLQWQDVRFVERDGRLEGSVLSRKGKTDQLGKGHTAWLSPLTCTLLKRWHRASGSPEFGLVFGDTGYQQALKLWTEVSLLMGRQDKPWSTHSARIGAVTDMVEAGAEIPQIMLTGGWTRPDMIAVYARNALAANNGMAKMRRQYYEREATLLAGLESVE